MKNTTLYHFDDHNTSLRYKTVYFTSKLEATKAAAGKGEWGSDAYVNETEVYLVDTAEEYQELTNLEEIQGALGKLSESEIDLLKKAWGVK